MGVEIERKFLVASDAWRMQSHRRQRIRQGYLAVTDSVSIRVRIVDGEGSLTVKSRDPGQTRDEFEHPILREEAEALLIRCPGTPIDKVRHSVDFAGRTWSIDEFLGTRSGLVIAECEIESEDVELALPDWVSAEVTNDPAYRNEAL